MKVEIVKYMVIILEQIWYIVFQGGTCMNVRPAQGAGADDAEAMDCRCWVDGYANTSRRWIERPAHKTPGTHWKGIVCAILSTYLTLPAQHILFYVICTCELTHYVYNNFRIQCVWIGVKNDNYLASKCYSCWYQTDNNNSNSARIINFHIIWRWNNMAIENSCIVPKMQESSTLRIKIGAGMKSFSYEDDKKYFFHLYDLHWMNSLRFKTLSRFIRQIFLAVIVVICIFCFKKL